MSAVTLIAIPPRIEITPDPAPARRQRGHYVIEDQVGNVLVEDPLIAVRPKVGFTTLIPPLVYIHRDASG